MLSFEGMHLSLSSYFKHSSLQLFMTVYAGLPTKDETTMTTWSS